MSAAGLDLGHPQKPRLTEQPYLGLLAAAA